MNSDALTISSLTTEPDDLTALHQNSDLQVAYDSRRTETGFLIKASRLPNYVPLPATNITARSWIWDHRILLGYRNNDNEVLKHWLCKICYHSDVHHPLPTYLLNVEKNTTKVIDHLSEDHYYDRKGNTLPQKISKKRKQGSLEAWSQQAAVYNMVFDTVG
jgi:hypothetical protein